MAEINDNDLISEGAIKAPLEMAKNVDALVKSLMKIISLGKQAEPAINQAKNVKETAEETKNLSLRQKELEKVEKQLASTQARNNKEYIKARAEIKKLQKEQRDLIDAEQELTGTEEKLLAANKRLRAERRKLNAETAEGKKRIEEINEEIEKNIETLKENIDIQNQGTMSVGQYETSLSGLFQQLVEVNSEQGNVKGFFATFIQGIWGAIKASLAFIATPIGAVIAAVVAGIAALTAVINNNEAASDEFNKIWGALSATFDVLFGRVIKLAKAFGRLLIGDFAGAADLASEAFDDLGGALDRAAKAGYRMVEMQIALEEATIKSTTATAILAGEIQRLNIIADDSTRSFRERETAAEKARQKEIDLAKINVDLAKQELAIINEEVKIAIEAGEVNRELRQKQADGMAKVIQAENELLATQLENEKVRRELRQDRLERDLDILIDGFDNVKTINERIIANDQAALAVRQAGLDKLTKLSQDSFNEQIKIIEEFAGKRIEVNQLLDEEDAKVLNERIRGLGLSEIIEGRLLEIVRERRTVLRDLLDLQLMLNGQAEAIKKIGLVPEFDQEALKNDTDEAFDNLKTYLDNVANAEKDNYAKRLEYAREFERIRKETTTEALMAGQELFATLSEAKIARIDEEIEAIQETRDKELEAAEGNEERQAEIKEKSLQREEALRQRQNQIRRKQAIAEKAIAIAGVVIDTARSIGKTIATLGYPVAIPFVALAAATGAVQIATIAAQPIPQFEKGTDSSPEGWAIINESGPELMQKNGRSFMVNSDGPTYAYLQAGTKVFPHDSEETQAALGASAKRGLGFNAYDRQPVESLAAKEIKGLRGDMRKMSMRNTAINISRRGVEKMIQEGHNWSKIVNEDYA